MSKSKSKHCEDCGETDRVETVVMQVAGKLKMRRRLCRCCQMVAMVAFGGCLNPWRNR